MLRNPLRLLDCKETSCRAIIDGAPRISDYLCPACETHFLQVQEQLQALGIPFALNHKLVRGLDYYTRTVFEIVPQREGGQSTIVGGGRYDGLIEQIGGKPTPAVGFATGIERIILNLKEQELAVPPLAKPMVYLAHIGEVAMRPAVVLAATLRSQGISVIATTGGKSLKSQLRQAHAAGARYTVIIGENEVRHDEAIVRDMSANEQITLPTELLPQHFASL